MTLSVKKYESSFLQENTYIIKDTETGTTALIDPGCCTEEMENFIGSVSHLDYILLTHAHGDHIRELDVWRKKHPEAELVAHSDEKEMLNSSSLNGSLSLYGKIQEDDADIYVKDGDELSFGNTFFRFIHTPGHTKGSMCILIDGMLFSGDTLFLTSVGRTDLNGGSHKAILDSIRNKLFSLPENTKVFTGHGPATDINYEKRFNPFV